MDMGKCDICGNPSKYKCPACQKRSCSVNCVRIHKNSSGCTGSVDPARFIPKPDLLTAATLDRDYNFLQTIGREIVVEKSDAKQVRVFKPRDQWRAGSRVHCMAKGMTRSVANKSHWDASTKQFEWTVEVINGINRQLFQVGDQTMVSALPALFGAPESYMIKLRDYYGNELTLNRTQTFQQALKGKNILEFPTLVIAEDIGRSSDSSDSDTTDSSSDSSDSSGNDNDDEKQSDQSKLPDPTTDLPDTNKNNASGEVENSYGVNNIDDGQLVSESNVHHIENMHKTSSNRGSGNEIASPVSGTTNIEPTSVPSSSGIKGNSNGEQQCTSNANPSNRTSGDTATFLESNNGISRHTADVINSNPTYIGVEFPNAISDALATAVKCDSTAIVNGDSPNAINGALTDSLNGSTVDENSNNAVNIGPAIGLNGAALYNVANVKQTNTMVVEDSHDSSEEPEEQSAKHI